MKMTIQELISLIILIIIAFHLLKALFYIIINLPVVLDNIKAFLKWLWKIITFPFRLIASFYNFIKRLINEHKRRTALRESYFNIIPSYFKISRLKRFFFRRLYKDDLSRLNCIEGCEDTRVFINNNIKYLNLIETSVGGGKSSLMSGLSHYITLKYMDEIEEKIEDTKKILYKIDFDVLDEKIENYYSKETSIQKILDKILDDENIAKYIPGYFDNYRQLTPYMTLLEDYITAYCARIRNNYVMSNFKLLNRITDTFNIVLRKDAFDIKKEEAKKKYYIPSYCIITEDELTVRDDLKNTESGKRTEDTGRDTALRLFRQLKNETTCYIGAAQNTTRVAKIVRELANVYIVIDSLTIHGVQKNYSRKFQRKEDKLLLKLSNKRVKEKNILKIKKKIFDLYQMQNKVFAAGYLKYKIRYAHDIKALERYNDDSVKQAELFFPMTWCFGTYLKCQFNELDKLLMKESGCSDSDLKVISDFFVDSDTESLEDLLKNREERRLEREEEEKKKKEKKTPKKDGEK